MPRASRAAGPFSPRVLIPADLSPIKHTCCISGPSHLPFPQLGTLFLKTGWFLNFLQCSAHMSPPRRGPSWPPGPHSLSSPLFFSLHGAHRDLEFSCRFLTCLSVVSDQVDGGRGRREQEGWGHVGR